MHPIIKNAEKKIVNKTGRKYYQFSTEWFKKITTEPGIYAFFENDKMVYVGETGSLRGRFKDSTRTVNHTLRRTIGKKKYNKLKGFREATSYTKYPEHIEKKITNYMKTLTVKIVPIKIGRTEIEEFIIDKYKPVYNNKTKRNGV